MTHRIFVRSDAFNQWHACFADEPQVEFGGDTPGTALTRLVEACPERAIDRHTSRAVDAETTDRRLVFEVDGSIEIRDRAQLRRVFAMYR